MDAKTITLLLGLAITLVLSVTWLRSRKSPRPRKKASGGGLAWAVLFLSGGRMPPPPPQSQIEQDAQERKNRAIGRDTQA